MNTKLRTFRLTLLVLSLWVFPASAQKRDVIKDRPFEPAEQLTYKAEYSRSLLRKIDVANFKLTVTRVAASGDEKPGNNGLAYKLKLTGDVESQGFFAKLFGISFRQRVESTVEPASFVVQRTIRLDEQGKRVRSSEAVFDRERGQVTWIERDPKDPSRPERKITSEFKDPIQDILSAIYFLRTRSLEPGKKFEVSVSDSGRVYQVPILVGERKRMKTPLGRVSVVKIEPQLFGPGAMIAETGKFFIWLTDDNRRIPVSARVKTEYGTFEITLKKALLQPALLVSTQ